MGEHERKREAAPQAEPTEPDDAPLTVAERLRRLAAAAESGADVVDTLGDIARHTRAFAGLKLGALSKRIRERSKK